MKIDEEILKEVLEWYGENYRIANETELMKKAIQLTRQATIKKVIKEIEKFEYNFKDIELYENGLDKPEGYYKAEEYFKELKTKLENLK